LNKQFEHAADQPDRASPVLKNNAIAYLELIRLPNVVTAAADSLAGWLLVTGSLTGPGGWLPLVGASMVLYASGTALNDRFDLEVDRTERPGRPLPSGRITPRRAALLGTLGLVLGPALALASGSAASGLVATALAVCILGYDAGAKRTWLGPPLMGACRGLNLLLGMSHASALGGPVCAIAALGYGLFVTAITVMSRAEVAGGGRTGLVSGLILQCLAILLLAAVALAPTRFPRADASRPLIPLEGILVLSLVALAVSLAAARAIKSPSPIHIQKAVKTGILSLVWLNVGLVAAVRGPALAATVAALWVPAYLLGRWLYAT
jgi:4-hydroxybenzoate polyprenyltransferase